MYRTAIFDLDGTLLDTLQDLADSANYALALHHLPARTVDEVRQFVGNGVGLLIHRAAPEGTPEALERQVLRGRGRFCSPCSAGSGPGNPAGPDPPVPLPSPPARPGG